MYADVEERPRVFSTGNYVLAVVVHLVLFLALWYIGRMRPSVKETAIPIELMVVVHENLDGVEDELPPDRPPEPTPPPGPTPPEPTPPAPDPPPVVQDAVIVEPVKEKPKPPEEKKPDPPKPPEEKKPEPPKKTREQIMEEMRRSATKVKDPPRPRNNGRTEQRPVNWEQLLKQGYKPGPVNQGLDASEEQRCKALIREAFYSKWTDRPAWTDQLGEIHLDVRFGPGGRVEGYELVKSSGDGEADRTVLRAASLVHSVRGLSSGFLERNKSVVVRFTVTP